MRPFKAATVCAFLLGGAAWLGGCGDSSGPGADVIPAALAGSWVAEPGCVPAGCGFMLTPVTNPADTLNATATFGITTLISITRGGSFSLAILPGAIPPATGNARLGNDPSILIVTSANGAVDTMDFTITGDVLNLRIRKAYEFPYITQDGVPVPAKAGGIFHRN